MGEEEGLERHTQTDSSIIKV